MQGFGRSTQEIAPQFVPAKDFEEQPVGSAEAQRDEAMRLVKQRNQLEGGPTLEARAAQLAKMNVASAFDFLDAMSPYLREQYLEAEKSNKGQRRVTVLRRYGWDL